MGLLLGRKSRNLRMFLCQIFFPSLGSRLPLIVTLSPKLWYLPFQNPNSPRRSKSLKHKNGKWVLNNGSDSSCVFWDSLPEGGGGELRGQGYRGRACDPSVTPTSSLVIFRVLCLYLCIKHPSPSFFFFRGT